MSQSVHSHRLGPGGLSLSQRGMAKSQYRKKQKTKRGAHIFLNLSWELDIENQTSSRCKQETVSFSHLLKQGGEADR